VRKKSRAGINGAAIQDQLIRLLYLPLDKSPAMRAATNLPRYRVADYRVIDIEAERT
jgi:hypothetical protein